MASETVMGRSGAPAADENDSTGQIRRRTELALINVATEGPEAIARRLDRIDREWTVERVVDAAGAGLGLLLLALGAFVSPWLLLGPALILGFLLQQAIMGWSPAIPLVRRLGVRRLREVDEERFALKALRGDFERVGDPTTLRGDKGLNAIKAARS